MRDDLGRVRPTATHGLYLLDAQHGVLLVGADGHQEVLARYAPARPGAPVQLVVELGFAPSPTGEPGVEARIRGDRVGLLPESDAAWYRPLLERAERQGVRPGCAAHVRVDESGGLEVELFLPVGETPEALGPAEFPERHAATPPESVEAGRSRRGRLPIWLGLTAAVLILAVVAVVGYAQWGRWVDRSAAGAPPPSAVAQPPPAAPLSPAPAPSPSAAPAPQPAPAQPLVRTPTSPRPPISNGGCDPNYSGACVPIASQVQCAGPGRSGPLVVRGPFRVTGTDLYQLDPDHDGIACGTERPVSAIPPPPRARSELSASATSAEPTGAKSDDDSADN